MPTSSAPAGLIAAARMARPSQVLVSTKPSTTSTRTATSPPYTCDFGRNNPPTVNDSSAYPGRIAVEVLPQTVPMTASSTIANPKVSSTVEAIGAVRMGRTNTLYVTQPSANTTG